MYFLTHLFQVCYFSILVKLLSGYLLFAANFEDFHTIAKKLGTDNFPKSLIKSPSTRDSYEGDDYETPFEIQQKSHYQPHKKNSKTPIHTKIDFDELVERVKKRIEKELKEKYNIKRNAEVVISNNNEKENKYNSKQAKEVMKDVEEMSPIEYDTDYVDDITEKPKKSSLNKATIEEKRLEYADATIEMTQPNKKRKKTTLNENIEDKSKKSSLDKHKIEEKRLEYVDATIEITTPNKKRNKKSTYNDEYSSETITYTYRPTTEKKDKTYNKIMSTNDFVSKEAINLPFEKIHMSKKDSYEDYKVPEKETYIYSSAEIKPQKHDINEKRFKIEKHVQKKIFNKETETKTKGFKSYSKKIKLKKTSPNNDYVDKLIDSAEIKAKTEYARDFDKIVSKENTKKGKSGTNIPTRERYIAITPNYNAKLPILVEKYNFEEPIPDRDRERENLKYYGNPPARINKKIRLI